VTQPMVGNSSKRRHNGGTNALPEKIARVLGWRRHRVEAALWGPLNLALICARVIEALRQAGASDTLLKFAAPLRAAINGTPPRFTPEIQIAARQADADEDVAEEKFNLCRRREQKDGLLLALDREIAAKIAERDALAAAP